jgi:hypothetical protein
MSKNKKSQSKRSNSSKNKKAPSQDPQILFPELFNSDDDTEREKNPLAEKWIEEQLSRNLSVEEFNANEDLEGFYLEVAEGSFSKFNSDKTPDIEEYKGKCLFLYHKDKAYSIEVTRWDQENLIIPREFFEAIAYWD